jgi:hypothetical protein
MKIFGVRLSGLGGTIKKELDVATLDNIQASKDKDTLGCVVANNKDGSSELFDFVEFEHDW